jgi:hypothetical protein
MRIKFSPRKFKKIAAAKRVEDKKWETREGEVIVREGESDTLASVNEPLESERPTKEKE